MIRPPGRTPGLSPRQCNRVASPGKARAALSVLSLTCSLNKAQSQRQLLLRSDVFTPDDPIRMSSHHDQAGSSPRRATLFFASPKKRGKKGDPMIAPRCAGCPCQRYPERGAAELAPLRSTQTDAAPFPAPGTADTARSTGFHCNGHFKGNFKSNGNCRCA